MLRRTFDRLLKESMDKPWHEQIRNFFGNHVRKVGLFGVTLELSLQDSDLRRSPMTSCLPSGGLWTVLRTTRALSFSSWMTSTVLRVPKFFANWLKSTVDEISTSQRKMPLCILVVGLEERRQELVSKQPSLARVFELIDIAPWSDDEAMDFYRKAFDSVGAKVAATDIRQLVRFTGGLPGSGPRDWRRCLAHGPRPGNRFKRSVGRNLDRGRVDRLETGATPGVQGYLQ